MIRHSGYEISMVDLSSNEVILSDMNSGNEISIVDLESNNVSHLYSVNEISIVDF